MFENDPADGALASIGFGGGNGQKNGIIRGIEDPGVIDFGKIVVFGGEPENGDGGCAASGQLSGEMRGADGFVDRIRGARKQADLLSGDDGDGSRFGEAAQCFALAVLGAQSFDHGAAASVRIIDLGCGAGQRLGVVRVVFVEASNAFKLIGEVRE